MTLQDDYDGPWKEALEAYLPEIVAFFVRDHRAIEEEYQMTYVTSAERIGRAERLHEAITVALEARFTEANAPLIAEINEISDPEVLRAIMARAMIAASLDEIRAVYESGA